MTAQLITPTPNIPCKPGWCLEYVRSAYGLPAAYPTATAAWEASTSKHQDRDFPEGCWVPLWFSLEAIPAGHVALLAPDGSVYSSSDNSTTPHHHPDLNDLMAYYARYNLPLTYLGWTEDVAGYPVITFSGIAAQGPITNLSSSIINHLEESGVTLELKDLQAIQGFVNTSEGRIIADNRAQVAFYTDQLAQKIADNAYQVKVFTQAVDNQNTDRAITDNRAQEEATRNILAGGTK